MSWFWWVFFTLVFLLIVAVIFIVIKSVDWKGFFNRRYGKDYRKGLAHCKVEDIWMYVESKLVYESDVAYTYTRATATGDILDDIVPKYDASGNRINYGYDEETGGLVYRAYPGMSVCTTDDGEPPRPNMTAALISTDTLGKIAVKFGTSVKDEGEPFNWKPWLVGAVVIIGAVVVLFASGILHRPAAAPAPAPAPITAPAPTVEQGGAQ